MKREILQLFYDKGFELLKKYREAGLQLYPEAIPTREWYQRRMWAEAYRYWETWKPEYVDVSDVALSKMTPEQRDKVIKREKNRLNYGLWTKDPAWDGLSEERKAEIVSEFPWAPYIQLLSPYQYFLLNYLEVSIKGRGVCRPTFFRRDALFWDVHDILENRTLGVGENRGMLLVFKTRGSHFSTQVITKCVRNLFIKEKSAYSVGLAIDVEDKISQYARKTVSIFKSVPDWLKPVNPLTKETLLKRPPTTSKDNAKIGLSFWDKDKNRESPFQNEILIKGHIPQAWEDLRLDSFIIDEAGICAYDIQNLIDKGSACMRNEVLQEVGLTIVGGTSDAQNEKNNPTFLKFKDYPEKYNAFIFFSGAQHIGLLDEYGFNDEEAVKKMILAERQGYREIGDIRKLTSKTVINPLTVEDCLYISGSVHIDVERASAQKKRCMELMSDTKDPDHYTIRKGWFRENEADYLTPIFIPDNKGGWSIIEDPSEEIRRDGKVAPHYFAGVDNVDAEISLDAARKLNEENIGRLSKSCCVIMNMATKKVVAYYLFRHGNPKQDYLQMLLGVMYYNCYAFVEGNKPKNIEFFKTHAAGGFPAWYFTRWLYRTPIVWGGNYTKVQNPMDMKYGLYTSPQKKKWYENYIIPYMETHTEDIFFPELIEAMIRWNIDGRHSPDIGMAFMICLMGADDYQNSAEFRGYKASSNKLKNIYSALKDVRASHTFSYARWSRGIH